MYEDISIAAGPGIIKFTIVRFVLGYKILADITAFIDCLKN
jgi:hypothetical protein